MKKATIVLAFMIALSGCVAAPVSNMNPSQSESVPASADESTSSQAEESSSSLTMIETPASSAGETPSSLAPEDIPQPEAPPKATTVAIDLPQALATSESGYSVELLTPAQYDSTLDPQRGGPRGFPGMDVFYVGQGGKYALANANGKIITDFAYENDTYWGARYGMTRLIKDGKWGMVSSADGKVVVPFEHEYTDTVYMGDGLITVSDGDTQKILNKDGTTRYEMERGDDFFVLGGSEFLFQDGMLRIYSHADGTTITNFACEAVEVASRSDEEGFNLASVQINGLWGVCDEKGNMLIDPDYDESLSFYGDYAQIEQNGRKGLINYKGKKVIKPEWDDMIFYGESASVCRDGKWGAITDLDTGKVAIDPHYDFIGQFIKGYASFERGGKYGILDKDGNEIIPAKYDTIVSASDYLDGGALLLYGDNGPGSQGIIRDGKVVLPTDNYVWGTGTGGYAAKDEPYLLFCTPRDKYGYLDRTGKIAIDAQFDLADSFIEGKDVAFVKKDGRIALIDRKGKAVLQTVFSDLVAFNPETMVGVFSYTNDQNQTRACIAKVTLPA